jgi:transcriptional regulator with GAF, ATPase, and Fis domain
VIGRAAVISTSPTLQLPEGWNKKINLPDSSEVNLKSDQERAKSPDIGSHREATLGELEKAHILEVLHQTKWRIEGPSGAALILGLHPNTLRSRMHRFGIQRPGAEKDNDSKRSNGKTIATH